MSINAMSDVHEARVLCKFTATIPQQSYVKRQSHQIKGLDFGLESLLGVWITHGVAHVHLLTHHLCLVNHLIPEKEHEHPAQSK